MNNKEKFRKGIMLRLGVMIASTILPIILLVLFAQKFFQERFVVYHDLVVLRYAIFVLLEGYIGTKI